jgi:uncharacterized protein (DUF1697 family)
MTTHIALLRAVNISRNRAVKMPELRDFAKDLGFANVRTFIQSGNLVFKTSEPTGFALERLLEAEAAKRLGLQTDFIVRTAEEWKRIIADNPLPDYAERDPSHLLVFPLKQARNPQDFLLLQNAVAGPEIVSGKSKEAYIAYPNGIGRSRLTISVIERHLGTRSTGRNWNTVVKLGVLAGCQRPVP